MKEDAPEAPSTSFTPLSNELSIRITKLEYVGLDTSRIQPSYGRVFGAIAGGDFAAAQVKKLANLTHGKFYHAKLDGANRLLFTLIRHNDAGCASSCR